MGCGATSVVETRVAGEVAQREQRLERGDPAAGDEHASRRGGGVTVAERSLFGHAERLPVHGRERHEVVTAYPAVRHSTRPAAVPMG